jgi:rhodanese-related sulfurtransferase
VASVRDEAGVIFEKAAERGRTLGLAYAGAVTPQEAWALHQSGAATIVDVRTQAEYEYVGHIPDTVLVEWRKLGERTPDPQFIEKLGQAFPPDRPLLFLCRSAQRSHNAAALAARSGFAQAYNILEGFEGDLDTEGHRGTLGGWRKAGLPWRQG